MQYALVNGLRSEATPNTRGICATCGSETIAKCGSKVINHWAHYKKKDCDPWHENETPWHRYWKEQFPPECREITHVDPNGEIHRADIRTPSGIYIEVQHSPMDDKERLSREVFYNNLVWIIDGSTFRKCFIICHSLPSPNSDLGKDLVWYKAEWGMAGRIDGLCWKKSENKDSTDFVVLCGPEIREEAHKYYSGHHQYVWKKPRTTWLNSTRPVYIDFGGLYLFRLEMYHNYLPVIFRITKKEFLEDCMTLKNYYDIGTRQMKS